MPVVLSDAKFRSMVMPRPGIKVNNNNAPFKAFQEIFE